MKRAVVTGLGFITSIGNSRAEVVESLRAGKSGVERFSEFDEANIPVKLAGTIKGFTFPEVSFEEWTFPDRYQIPREILRPMTPNALYAYFAMQEAIGDASLTSDMVSNDQTGLTCASGGSMWLAYANLHTMVTRNVMKCQPMAMINSIPGSLYINLVPAFGIKGPSVGLSSACSSSAHAVGMAVDLIRQGKQKIMFVVGAEDCSKFTILPFASIRALSVQTDPAKSPCAFDVKRDGFVGTGGASVLVVEELEHAQARKVPKIYAEVLGWGQASDGYNVLAPDPAGDGLARTMRLALDDAHVAAESIDYINAHATSTPFGDVSEANAIKQLYPDGKTPLVSSTKSLTGHGLSLAGAMEAGFCCLTLHEKFVPVSANITELDPACEGVSIVTSPVEAAPKVVMNNSSGFGGTNVSIIFGAWEGQV